MSMTKLNRVYASLLASALAIWASAAAVAQDAALSRDAARALIAPFYDALNRPATKDVSALTNAVLAPDWRSFSGETASKSRYEFVQQVIGFGKAIPDLTWTIREVVTDGAKIVVRSEASGTPAVALFGVPHGGKSFSIMTIDIHTVRNGKLAVAHHVEDWAGAVRQLSAK
jgi:predicted ester cyclase